MALTWLITDTVDIDYQKVVDYGTEPAHQDHCYYVAQDFEQVLSDQELEDIQFVDLEAVVCVHVYVHLFFELLLFQLEVEDHFEEDMVVFVLEDTEK